MRGGLGRRLSGQLHQPGHIYLHRWRTARQVALNPLQPLIQVALVPARNLHAPDAQWLGDVLVLQALRASSTICARCANLTLVAWSGQAESARALVHLSEKCPVQLSIDHSNANRSSALDAGISFKNGLPNPCHSPS